MRLTTLCYIEKDGQFLMLHRNKKENDQSQGKWLGVGGKLEADETPEECMLREVYEETNLTLNSYKYRGLVTFISNVYETEYMFIYTSNDYKGEIKECSEGTLEWVKFEDIFNLKLWEGDKVFLKKLMDGKDIFSIKLRYDNDTLVEVKE